MDIDEYQDEWIQTDRPTRYARQCIYNNFMKIQDEIGQRNFIGLSTTRSESRFSQIVCSFVICNAHVTQTLEIRQRSQRPSSGDRSMKFSSLRLGHVPRITFVTFSSTSHGFSTEKNITRYRVSTRPR